MGLEEMDLALVRLDAIIRILKGLSEQTVERGFRRSQGVCALRRARLLACGVFSAFVVGLGSIQCVRAQATNELIRSDIRISSDLAVTETIHQEKTPLVETAVPSAGQMRWLTHGNQTFEVLEAFTRKADGRIIQADPKDFVTQDGAVGAAVSFADVKAEQIAFRDVSIGDTAVLTLQIVEKEHYIPGQFSQMILGDPSAARETMDVYVRAPATLALRHDEQQLLYGETREGDEIVRHWSGSFTETTTDKNIADLALLVPGLRISTFPGYEAVATSYYDQAKTKAAITPEIQRLADEIAAGKRDVRTQAEAIFNWVSHNVRYVAIYFGSGRFVPNDTSTILARRFGDCKDEAILLSALLGAKGIASEQVLLNVDQIYQFPPTATVGAFNHVIVYIPSLDLYVDPTVSFGSFYRLPTSDVGKPVVRVSDKGATLAHTPIPSVDENVVEIDTRVSTARDGRRTGQTTVLARGEFTDPLRLFVAQTEAKGKDVELQALAQQRGLTGTFDIEAPAWTDAHEPYRITTKWETPKPANPADARPRVPAAFSPILPHPSLFFGPLDSKKRTYPAACRAGRIVHTVHLTLPDNVLSVKLPPILKRSTPLFSFTEEWSRDGQSLQVRTELRSSVATRVCNPNEIDAVTATFKSVQNRATPLIAFARAAPIRDEARPSVLQQLFGGRSANDRSH
jgi:hypothetical protein